MKHILLLLLSAFALTGSAKVYYLNNGDSIPPGTIKALEARCKLPSARAGRLSGWSLDWPGGSVAINFDLRNMVEGITEPDVTVTCGDNSGKVSDADFSGGWNSLAVEWDANGVATVLAGAKELRPVLTLENLPRPGKGYLQATAPIRLDIMDLIVETDDNALDRLMTDCDPARLRSWNYLDRSGDPSRALPGGEYSIGLLPTQDGFDIIYLGGAKINGTSWRPGMRKGKLTSRGFDGHYLLKWYDATGRQIPGEHFATLDAPQGILTLTFPTLDTTLRFAR